MSVLIEKKSIKGSYLKNEFVDFHYSVGFSIFYSDENNKASKKKYSRLFYKIDQKETDYYKNEKHYDLSAKNYEAGRWKKYFHGYYSPNGQAVSPLGFNPEKNKKWLIKKVSDLFNNKNRDASIVVYFGMADNNGDWIIPFEGSEEKFKPEDLFELWVQRKSKQKTLTLILDHNHSGKWVSKYKAKYKKERSIVIQASCQSNQKSYTCDMGGFFTHNLFKLLYIDGTNILELGDQEPAFGGDYLQTKKFTNLYLKFQSWEDMKSLSKASYEWTQADGQEYYGFLVGGTKKYWGTLEWFFGGQKNGSYKGEFDQNKISGKGMLTYPDGRIVEGSFLNSKVHGFGVEKSMNGDEYEGNYDNGFKKGKGTYRYNNGDVYVGKWNNDLPNGEGLFTMANGNVYTGTFKDGMCHGKGEFKYYNGDKYEGDWLENEKHGEGTYTYSNGDIYTGGFMGGKKNGYGEMSYDSGALYKGTWAAGKQEGEGIYWNEKGTQLEGQWKKGKLLRDISFHSKHGSNRHRFK